MPLSRRQAAKPGIQGTHSANSSLDFRRNTWLRSAYNKWSCRDRSQAVRDDNEVDGQANMARSSVVTRLDAPHRLVAIDITSA